MVRVVVLLALAGCQLVYPHEPEVPPSACGSFRIDGREEFTGLAEVVEFSVDATGVSGFAKGIRNGATTPFLFPIKRAGDTWIVDDARLPAGATNQLDVLQTTTFGLRQGIAAPSGDLFAGVVDVSGPTAGAFRVLHLQLSPEGNGWGGHADDPTQFVAADSTLPGGAFELVEAGGVLRQLPVLHVFQDEDRFLSILTQLDNRDMVGDPWNELLDNGVLATEAINATHEAIEQASLARGPNGSIVIAYQAIDGGESRLFLTEKDGELFPRGVHLDEIDGDGNEVEPFLSPDCKTLWFRRGGTIFRAVSIDSP